LRTRITSIISLFLLSAGCAGVTSLPDYSGPARTFLEQYLDLASKPGKAELYFSGRDKWERAHALDRSRLAELVKDDSEGAHVAFDTVLDAAEAQWRNMEYYLRRSSRNIGQAGNCKMAAIADLMVAVSYTHLTLPTILRV